MKRVCIKIGRQRKKMPSNTKKTFNYNDEHYKIVCLDAIYTACVDRRSYF